MHSKFAVSLVLPTDLLAVTPNREINKMLLYALAENMLENIDELPIKFSENAALNVPNHCEHICEITFTNISRPSHAALTPVNNFVNNVSRHYSGLSELEADLLTAVRIYAAGSTDSYATVLTKLKNDINRGLVQW